MKYLYLALLIALPSACFAEWDGSSGFADSARIAGSAGGVVTHATTADTATYSDTAFYSDSAAWADTAGRARTTAKADSTAGGALRSDTASVGRKALLADSTTGGAVRSRTSAVADSCKGRSVASTLSDSAAGAIRARSADTARAAGVATTSKDSVWVKITSTKADIDTMDGQVCFNDTVTFLKVARHDSADTYNRWLRIYNGTDTNRIYSQVDTVGVDSVFKAKKFAGSGTLLTGVLHDSTLDSLDVKQITSSGFFEYFLSPATNDLGGGSGYGVNMWGYTTGPQDSVYYANTAGATKDTFGLKLWRGIMNKKYNTYAKIDTIEAYWKATATTDTLHFYLARQDSCKFSVLDTLKAITGTAGMQKTRLNTKTVTLSDAPLAAWICSYCKTASGDIKIWWIRVVGHY